MNIDTLLENLKSLLRSISDQQILPLIDAVLELRWDIRAARARLETMDRIMHDPAHSDSDRLYYLRHHIERTLGILTALTTTPTPANASEACPTYAQIAARSVAPHHPVALLSPPTDVEDPAPREVVIDMSGVSRVQPIRSEP